MTVGTDVAIAVAVVLAVVAVLAVLARRRARRDAQTAAHQVADFERRVTLAEQRRDEARDQAARAQTQAQELQAAAASSSPAGSAATPPPVLDALWRLEALSLVLEAQRDPTLPAATVDAGGVLVAALRREVERIREEMGTPGELRSELTSEPGGDGGLVLLRSTRLALDAVAWQCQAYDLVVVPAADRVEARVVCEGLEAGGQEAIRGALQAVTDTIESAGGRAEWVAGGEHGPAEVRLSAPASWS